MEAEKEEKKPIGKIADTTEDIIETYRKLITLNLVEYTSLGASASAVGIVYLIFIVFVLLFAGLGLAWWLGESMSNMKAGFFIVSGAYTFIILLVMLTAKRKIIPFIRNLIIKEIYDAD
jgi:hypothetical protein